MRTHQKLIAINKCTYLNQSTKICTGKHNHVILQNTKSELCDAFLSGRTLDCLDSLQHLFKNVWRRHKNSPEDVFKSGAFIRGDDVSRKWHRNRNLQSRSMPRSIFLIQCFILIYPKMLTFNQYQTIVFCFLIFFLTIFSFLV